MATSTLPLDEPPDGDRADGGGDQRSTRKLRAQERRPKRVALVVDDSDDVHDLCRGVLEDEGFSVQTALDGQDALDLLIALPTPAVILLDLLMPRMGGIELLELIRSYRRLADVPILVITASDEALQPGPRLDVLRKPIRCDELAERIRGLLGDLGSLH